MSPYFLITSGKNQRREYLCLNRSPLFQSLPEHDFAQEQITSYHNFLFEKLPQLINFYFPENEITEFSDYNNKVKVSIGEIKNQEPDISEQEARDSSLTWNYQATFTWKVSWDFYFKQIQLTEEEQKQDLEKNIRQWIEKSFKIGKFTCKKKDFSSSELKSLLIKTREELQELSEQERERKSGLAEKLTSKIRSLEQNEYQVWLIKETKKQGKLKITLEILEAREKNLAASFNCEQTAEVVFCHLPKMNPQGNFIINGHEKVVVFQSVRAPSVYFFSDQESRFQGEIIPFKGPWINISYSYKKPQTIEIKFLNSKLVVDLLKIFRTFSLPVETLEKLFNPEELNFEDYQNIEPLEIGTNLPNFLFTERNSYFSLGKLGRKKYNQKLNILHQVVNRVLATDLKDKNNKIVLKKNTVLDEKNLLILQNSLRQKKLPSISIPHSTNDLYVIKIKSSQDPAKVISVVGSGEDVSEQKTYFDLADLISIIASYINLSHGLGKLEKEEEKDELENQTVRRVGDLVYNIFENKLGGFLQNLGSQYVTNYLSQLKKVDLLKIPGLKEFDNLIRHFFNTSALVQLQNQNNPLAETSYTRKLSVLGLGGFSSANTTLAARNVNASYYGRYDLVETPEGQKVGLIHNLTIGAKINEYGQVVVGYYPVRNGTIVNKLEYLTSEEEKNKYIAHFNLKIDEKNQIQEKIVLTRYQKDFALVPKEKIDYIESSFYQLNSITSSTIPFFSHNDATRMLMSSNMQRQAVILLKNQAPLVASGIEASLLNNSSLVIKAEEKGQVEYADSQQIIIKSNKEKKPYKLKQSVVSNKNILNFSFPAVKKGTKVEKGQIIATGNYANNGELSLGYNLRVAYLCWNGYNYEDAIILNERLVKEDLLTSLFVKKHTVVRYKVKCGSKYLEEKFTASFPHANKNQFSHLNKNGIVKIGSEVKEGDILVGKLTPQLSPHKETEEEKLLNEILKGILGENSQQSVDSSLRLPTGEKGTVCKVKKKKKLSGKKNELELVEIYVAHERKIEVGDKLTTRFGNKGVVAKIVPESDMPFDEEGKTIDIIFNPLGIPTRMNMGQLLETILASAAYQLNTQFLIRPFNTPSLEIIKEIMQEAKIKQGGSQQLFDGRTGLPFQQKIYNGYVYVLKLNHMVIDKLHARNTGPYSLIYQQPLKGRSREGGQRVGEMEVWALEAHGAAYNLMEMMSAKSDDISKRRLMQKSLIFDERQVDLGSSQSESFNLLIQNLWGIGFDLQATDYRGKEIDFYEVFSRKKREKQK